MNEPRGPEPEKAVETGVLIAAAQRGDQAALTTLVARYYPAVVRMVRVRLGSFLRGKLEVEDVVQAVLLDVCRDLGGFEVRTDARLANWLAKVVQNQVANLVEHYTAEKRDAGELSLGELDLEGSSLGWQLVSESTGPFERLSRNEVEEVVDACLAELPETSREVILLRAYAGMSWEEVAFELGRPSAQSAQQLYQRAKRKLVELVTVRLPDA